MLVLRKVSAVVGVRTNCREALKKFTVYPNFISNGTDLKVKYSNSDKRGEAKIIITDMSGRQLLQKSVIVTQGINIYPLSTIALSSGTYFIYLYIKDWKTPVNKFIIK